MEAFSLLKYWRGGATTNTTSLLDSFSSSSSSSSSASTTIVTAVSPRSSGDDDDDDDGPFFDLQFTQLPDETQHSFEEKKPKKEVNDKKRHTISETINIINVEDNDDEDDDNDNDISVSPPPSDENLFFKGSFEPIEPSSLLEGNAKLPNSLSKSAAKFRVLMLKLKRSKENTSSGEMMPSVSVNEKENHSRKFFTVKFVKENRRRAQRSGGSVDGNASNGDDDVDKDEEDNKFLKDVMHKYLKMVNPLHNIRVSKLKLSGQLMSFSGTAVVKGDPTAAVAPSAPESSVKILKKSGNLSAGMGLRDVCKHLGKSKSASLASTATAGAGAAAVAPSASRRRDDSLLQQQDGIQSAILHCKRSFNASRDCKRKKEKVRD